MSEHAMERSASAARPGNEADVIPLPVHKIGLIEGHALNSSGHFDLERTEIWSPLDSTMTPQEIDGIVENIHLPRVMHNVPNYDRPVILAERLLIDTHISVEYAGLRDRKTRHLELKQRLEERRRTNPKASLYKNQKKFKELTPYEEQKLEIGEANRELINEVVKELASTREELGPIGLVESLEDVERRVAARFGGSNIVRVYNALAEKLGRDPDVLVTGRIIMKYLDSLPEDTEFVTGQ